MYSLQAFAAGPDLSVRIDHNETPDRGNQVGNIERAIINQSPQFIVGTESSADWNIERAAQQFVCLLTEQDKDDVKDEPVIGRVFLCILASSRKEPCFNWI